MYDGISERTTHSRAGKVRGINFRCKDNFKGEAISVDSTYYDNSDRIPKPDLRKIKKEQRQQATKEYEEKTEMEKGITTNIYPNFGPHYLCFLGNQELTKEMFDYIQTEEFEKLMLIKKI